MARAGEPCLLSWTEIEQVFYHAFDYFQLPQWNLMRMPRNVNTHRDKIDKHKLNGWHFKRHSGKASFPCPRYPHKKQSAGQVSWTSEYGTLLFRARVNNYKDENNNWYHEGVVQLKIYTQGCKYCPLYTAAQFDYQGWCDAFYWLYIWILVEFYDHQIPRSIMNFRKEKTKPHRADLCEARRDKWCKYCNR